MRIARDFGMIDKETFLKFFPLTVSQNKGFFEADAHKFY